MNARVLDVGCGQGFLARQLIRRCSIREWIAFDIDPEAIRVARANLADLHQVSIYLLDAEVQNLSAHFGRFDIVLARNTFHHFKQKHDFLVSVRDELLTPGGTLLLLDLDSAANFALHGLGVYFTLPRALFNLGPRLVFKIIRGTRVLQAKEIRTHRETDRRRLIDQRWYTYREVIQQIHRCLPTASVGRIGSILGFGGCYVVQFDAPTHGSTSGSEQ